MTVLVHHEDCLDAMREMPDASVDAVVTDPPYGLEFMGKSWDHGIPGVPFWTEALRVANPGAHLVAFGGTRTFHRLAVAIEDAGWEIRDCLSWLYGSGFPKSLDVSKAIDKAAGAEREVTGARMGDVGIQGGNFANATQRGVITLRDKPATDAAREWQGWGTALKPAWEPIILARKPLDGTVAANVLAHGTGALNIDGCRIETSDNLNGGAYAKDGAPRHDGAENWRYKREGGAGEFVQPAGRWPANVALDEVAASMLDEQTGTLTSGVPGKRRKPHQTTSMAGTVGMLDRDEVGYADSGGASRFFYTAKASRKERGEGNTHPTVKPIALMRWVCRLVCPPGGVILDPFCGSGTTLLAAQAEGFDAIGIEREAEYVAIAEKRIKESNK